MSGRENAPPGKKCKLRHYPILGLVAFLGLLSVAHPAGADPPAGRGAALASACAVCHGPGGRSRGAIPGLNGLSPKALRQAMDAFRTEQRPATVMHYIATGLTPADIEAVVAHFGQEGES
ncbi:MAG: c-type cytochrome [Desulfurellaceae bacterium]|nr:c-type cytochrome [Desulfurellaceae bacterium]